MTNLLEKFAGKVCEVLLPIKHDIFYGNTNSKIALRPILEQMAAFSMRYCCNDVFKDGKPRTFQEVFGKSIKVKLSSDSRM